MNQRKEKRKHDGTRLQLERFSPPAGNELGTARSVGQRLTR
ncbi:MAG: hypothetical protein AB2693_22125 [Candidatus Thiodiazotropha sp.]